MILTDALNHCYGLLTLSRHKCPVISSEVAPSDHALLSKAFRPGGIMANPNPDALKARREARAKRRPKPGTVKQLTSVLWRAITHLETHLDTTATADEIDTAELCKLTHALSQSAVTYLKAVEVGELEARLEALEKAQAANQGHRWAA